MSALLSVNNLIKRFHTSHGTITAVNDVSFALEVGKTLALVGESGCGKSTIASTILRLAEPDSGTISFQGENVGGLNMRALQKYRQQVSIVFQNPYSSLDPRMKVRSIVGEPLAVCYEIRGQQLTDRVVDHLESVGMGPEHLYRHPHQFSGGQRQRIAIARALALEPRVLILDEPTAALDVSVQAQVLNLLQELKQRLNLAYLFISHNLATVEYIADYVMVMYLGRIVEQGPVATIFQKPEHPYTRALIDSVPSIDPARRNQLRVLQGELPDPLNLPAGCAFHTRCSQSNNLCEENQPALEPVNSITAVACYNPVK